MCKWWQNKQPKLLSVPSETLLRHLAVVVVVVVAAVVVVVVVVGGEAQHLRAGGNEYIALDNP